MTNMRVKDKIFFGYKMGRVNSHNIEQIKTRPLEEAIERNAIMQELNTLAWKMNVKGKEANRINWHYARRNKETNEQLKKLLADMKLEYVYQQAGGLE